MARILRARSIVILSVITFGCLTSSPLGCGGSPLSGGRTTLPSTVEEDSPGNDNGDDDTIDPAGTDPSDFRIETTQDPNDSGKWTFEVKATRQPINDNSLSFAWDFGDGTQHFGSTQEHVFEESGDHLVVVQALDRQGTLLFTLTLVVTVPQQNEPPAANAGPDQTVFEKEVVALSGASSSDPEGESLTFSWARVGTGPAVTLSRPNEVLTTFAAPEVSRDTVLQFELQVDDGTHTTQDVVLVQVLNSVAPAAAPPTAGAGPDQQVVAGDVVTLDGSDSAASADGPLSFEWIQTLGAPVVLSNAQAATTTFTAPAVTQATDLAFVLTVSEGDASAFDDVVITVAPLVTPPGGGGGGSIPPGGGDTCPSDPLKTAPGQCGCGVPDTDTDGDGTANCNDACPSDSGKTAPGLCGCGTPETDSDGDSTPDCNDLCPNDAAKIQPGQCGCGVSDVDSDGDSVPDCNDRCTGSGDVDSDGDGVLDCNDGCPADPLKTNAGVCGCGIPDTDSDTDGSPNCVDLCPNDSNKITPGTCGCGVADTDSDGDGRANCIDGCPNNPNKFAPGACGCNVADTDSDGDGSPNCLDGCPNDANKTAPGGCGCGFPEADGDGDTVCDNLDACPGFDDRIDGNSNGVPDGCESPSLCVTPTSLNFGLATTQLTFQVRNCGGGTLSYTVSDNQSWLSASPASGSSTGENDTVTATVSRSGLPNNTYGGTITVTPSTGTALAVIISMTVAQGGGPAPTVSLNPSRTSGVSPLGVFFDASGTTSPATSRPFHELHYTWDFGDPTATFKNARRCSGTAMPCNTSADCAAGQVCSPVNTGTTTGPMAAHVFELPRTCSGSGASCQNDANCPSGQTCGEIASKDYTVTLTVRDAGGNTATAQRVITVTRFSGQTYYVASGVNAAGQSTGTAGNDANTGLSPTAAFKTWDKGITMMFLSNGPRRVLFRRGDYFDAPQAFAGSRGIGNKVGPYVIGTYGTGSDPIIQSTHASTALEIKPSTRDVRIMDLEFQGPPPGGPSGSGLSMGTDCLVLRTTVREHLDGIKNGLGTISGTIVADSRLLSSDNYGIYISSGGTNAPPDSMGYLGNEFDLVIHEHLLRTYITRSVVAYNTFRNGVSRGTHLKLCAAGETAALKTQYVVIADNVWTTPTDSPGLCSIGPENSSSRQLVEDVIVERNVFDLRNSAGGQDAIHSWGANNVTVRNNLFLDSRAWVWFHTPVVNFSTWDDWQIYNNSCYRDINADTILIRGQNAGNVARRMVIRNNVAAVTRATAALVKALDMPYTQLSEIQSSHNLWYFPTRQGSQLFAVGGTGYTFASWQTAGKDANSLTVDPLFTSAPLNLSPQLSSPAVNSGTSLSAVLEDVVHVARPRGATFDMGAFERN